VSRATANRTRIAGREDIESLIELTLLARLESPLTAQLCTVEPTHLDGLLEAWIAMDGSSVIVAEVDGAVVGFVLAQVLPPNLFSDVSIIQIEGLFVRQEYRRRGLARNLLAEVSRIAEENDVEHIVTIILTGSRQELRFLAGLGFDHAGARRVVDVPTLNRRLTANSRERRIRGIDDLIERRRRSRNLTSAG